MNSGPAARNAAPAGGSEWKQYTLPFAALIVLLGVGPHLGLRPEALYPLRTMVVLATLLIFSRGVIALRPAQPVWSVLVGVAAFAIWIGPDLLIPGYRQHWMFHNALTGAAPHTTPLAQRASGLYLGFRVVGSVLLVPVVEELFWRAWLMRRLISPAVAKIPLGAYDAQAFWITALLFASEHGAFWDVGLAAGIIYNWWMIRTRSLADCILAHAATNASWPLTCFWATTGSTGCNSGPCPCSNQKTSPSERIAVQSNCIFRERLVG